MAAAAGEEEEAEEEEEAGEEEETLAARPTPLIIDARCETVGLKDIAGSRGVPSLLALIIFALRMLLLKLLLLKLLLASRRRRGCLCFITAFALTGW